MKDNYQDYISEKEEIEFVNSIASQAREITLPDVFGPPSDYLALECPKSDLSRTGLELLKRRKVAIIMMAGGLSTRMKCPGLRGDLPIGPVTKRSIFRLQGEKIAAIHRRLSTDIPWIVVTSSPVHKATLNSFKANNYFSVPRKNICFEELRRLLPVVDIKGNPVFCEDGSLEKSPIGHGGLLEIFETTDILDFLKSKGIEYIFYFQHPNVLENICDFAMLGYHKEFNHEVTTKVTFICYPNEKIGRLVQSGNQSRICEYHFLDNNKDKSIFETLPGNIGTHIFNVSFLERCIKHKISLPLYIVSHNSGNSSLPLIKIESFIFDLLRHSLKSGIVEADRNKEYAIAKNKSGSNSLESARDALNRLYISWLEESGAVPEPGTREKISVEISPLFALNLEELKERIPPRFRYKNNLVIT